MSQLIDITGQRFGKLTVVERIGSKPNEKGAGWRCVCDCGNETIQSGTALRRGDAKSCGCARYTKTKLEYIKNDPNWQSKRKSEKNAPCPYNEGVHCHTKDCWRCGFNPKVAKARRERMEVGNG